MGRRSARSVGALVRGLAPQALVALLSTACAANGREPTARVAPRARRTQAIARPAATRDVGASLPPRYEPPADPDVSGPRVPLLARRLAAGGQDVCAIEREHGDVWCWGFAMHPAQGPVKLVGPRDAVAIDVTNYSGCAATRAGEVWCWGSGLRGDGGQTMCVDDCATPTRAAMSGAVDVDVGHGQTCAVRADGHVACWGCLWPRYWEYQQNPDDRCPRTVARPEEIVGIDDAVEVAVAGAVACARRRDGRVVCWGGLLGARPRDVGVPLSTSMAGEDDDVCGTSRWGDVWCIDAGGRYGIALALRASVQVTMAGPSRCGVRSDGTVVCEGIDELAGPHAFAALRDVAFVAHNHEQTCALHRDGRVSCVGDDRMGAVGDPAGERRLTPRLIDGLDEVAQISSGLSVTCARRRDGSIACWGGQPTVLAVTDGLPRARPTPVAIPPAVDVAVGERLACAVHADGALTCWGEEEDGRRRAPAAVSSIREAIDVAAGTHVCAVTRGGVVRCLTGYPRHERIQALDGLPPIARVDAIGDDNFVGHTSDGAAWLWGFPIGGDAVEPNARSRSWRAAAYFHSYRSCVLSESRDLSCSAEDGLRTIAHGVESFAVGQNHGCAILAGGEVDCWGEMFGQIVHPDDEFALRRVPLPERPISIDCGDRHTCALLTSGRVACWGERGEGLLGDGSVSIHREPLSITVPAP